MLRSTSVTGLLSADLEPERKPDVVAQFFSDGRCPEYVHWRTEQEQKSAIRKSFVGREPNRPGRVSAKGWRYPRHADCICREWIMWLALTAIVLAPAIGFNVLAVAIQHYD
jgi:hypothetical protein